MANLEQKQEKLQKAKEELTKALAIMDEVKSNIAKEIASLKEFGVTIPERDDCEDEVSWYKAIENSVKEFITKQEDENKEREKEVDEILEKWED